MRPLIILGDIFKIAYNLQTFLIDCFSLFMLKYDASDMPPKIFKQLAFFVLTKSN